MDRSKANPPEDVVGDLDRVQRVDDGDSKGIPSNHTTTAAAAPPIPTITTTAPSTGPSIIATTSPPISTVEGSTVTNPNAGQFYAGSFFNIASDARSEFGGTTPESIPDVNAYQNKKTVAQGMMDLALFSANANQLRYVMENGDSPYFWTGVVLISISLMFQVGIGIGLLLNTRYNVKDKKEICIANTINNFTIVGIFLVTVINVFISAFGVASIATPLPVSIGNRFGNSSDLNYDFE